MPLPTPEHFIFIPVVLLIGVAIGWRLGARAALTQLEEKARRARE